MDEIIEICKKKGNYEPYIKIDSGEKSLMIRPSGPLINLF